MSKDHPRPVVFTNHYFRYGLRFSPKHGRRVVYLPDIDWRWVHLNLIPEYRAPYLLRLLESLLYLRTYTAHERDEYLVYTLNSKKRKRGSDRSWQTLVTISFDGTLKSAPVSASASSYAVKEKEHYFPMIQREVDDHEMRRLLQAQKVVPGPDNNVDQDLWRLYDLWVFFDEREMDARQEQPQQQEQEQDNKPSISDHIMPQTDGNDDEGQGPDQTTSAEQEPSKKNRSPFPARPQIQIQLDDDVHYLRSIESVSTFDCFVSSEDYGFDPPLPILELQSRTSRGHDNKMRSAAAVATHPGPTPSPTPPRHKYKRRRHHQHRHHHRSRCCYCGHRHCRHTSASPPPPPSPSPSQPQSDGCCEDQCHEQMDPHLEQTGTPEQVASTTMGPFALAGMATTATTNNPTPKTVTTTATATALNPMGLMSSQPTELSLESACTSWDERRRRQVREQTQRNLYAQYRDSPQECEEQGFVLSPVRTVFGVSVSSLSPPHSLPSSPSHSQRSLFSSSSVSRREGGTTDIRTWLHSENKGEENGCGMETDMGDMSL